MKSLKQFMVNEAKDPPMVVVLKRIGIRNFAGGQRVALYKNDLLGLEFSVPYDPNGKLQSTLTSSIKEETLENLKTGDRVRVNDKSHPKHGQMGMIMYKGKDTSYLHFGLNDHSHPFKAHQLVKEDVAEGVEIDEAHEHKFSYLGGQAKCQCGMYLQPDGRITNVPYPGVSECLQINETAMHHINRIAGGGKEDLVLFRNGGSTRIHPKTAKIILDLHKKVNSTNQAKLAQLINSSPRGLEKVAKFALTHAQSK